MIDYFESVIRADIQYPTYKWLSEAGIVPSNQTAVNLTSVQGALAKRSGAVPYVSRPRVFGLELGHRWMAEC